jgi:hypothetical protein
MDHLVRHHQDDGLSVMVCRCIQESETRKRALAMLSGLMHDCANTLGTSTKLLTNFTNRIADSGAAAAFAALLHRQPAFRELAQIAALDAGLRRYDGNRGQCVICKKRIFNRQNQEVFSYSLLTHSLPSHEARQIGMR